MMRVGSLEEEIDWSGRVWDWVKVVFGDVEGGSAVRKEASVPNERRYGSGFGSAGVAPFPRGLSPDP